MRKQIVVATVLAALFAASASAQSTELFTVVMSGTPQDVQAVIAKGADVNAYNASGKTPLILAAWNNSNPEVITTLLKAGADIEARDLRPVGATPLLWAAWANSNPEVVTVLLKAGADLEARDTTDGKTALIWAAQSNQNPEMIIVLLKAGADAKVKSKLGWTAFDYAKLSPGLRDTEALKQLEEASK